MLPPIFIVGTGRSGTTILYRALGCHRAIHTFPREMRFLIDPGGLMDLIDALTTRYHPVQAREALYRFERLMRVYMTTPKRGPYRSFDMPAWIGQPYYENRLNEFVQNISGVEFAGTAWQIEPENEGRLVNQAKKLTHLRQTMTGGDSTPFRLTLPRHTLKEGRYFSDRSDLVTIAAEFVGDLFRQGAENAGKTSWSEKTPQHLLNLDFILELFPHSKIIHIKRDPRGVANSMTQQFWAPSDLGDACRFLQPVYARWQDMKQQVALPRETYMEIKLEDFAANPRETLTQICTFCGLEDEFGEMPAIDPRKVNYWQKLMSAEELTLTTELLHNEIEMMGY